MERTFREALRHRRSYYALAPESPIDDARIEEIVRFAIKHVPSAFNSQSTRAVLLLHEHHDELWKIVKRTLRAIVPEGAFARTEEKIEHSFAAGYGTVLSSKTRMSSAACNSSFRPMRGISRYGRSRHRPCTSWQSGRCWKTQGWGHRSNITTRSSTMRCANTGACPGSGNSSRKCRSGHPQANRAKRRSNRWTNASGCSDKGGGARLQDKNSAE